MGTGLGGGQTETICVDNTRWQINLIWTAAAAAVRCGRSETAGRYPSGPHILRSGMSFTITAGQQTI